MTLWPKLMVSASTMEAQKMSHLRWNVVDFLPGLGVEDPSDMFFRQVFTANSHYKFGYIESVWASCCNPLGP